MFKHSHEIQMTEIFAMFDEIILVDKGKPLHGGDDVFTYLFANLVSIFNMNCSDFASVFYLTFSKVIPSR